ncbi:MAG TPA: aldehyde dehydrogenase (NADP(+)) [Saprospiraceae bacterium]|nr:aldehyde dehydrogenase (NADP(+)) [Saprospiraceae bacterium]
MTIQEKVNITMQRAGAAAEAWSQSAPELRARFLETIAAEMEALGSILIQTAMQETNLDEARLTGERMRTTGQLRMYAAMLREGSWVEAAIDTAQEARPDLRKMYTALGPVAVFGASNFPLAYSTAGGDTASALAAGCPVVVKAHPAHPRTSMLVAGAIDRAADTCDVPTGVFQHLEDEGFDTGKYLVMHPQTRAVGFTGSLSGGMALHGYAQQRPDPIPVFAEMGSVNPMLVLTEAVSKRGEAIAQTCAGSITLGMGQFCTNPGLMMGIDCMGLRHFIEVLGQHIAQAKPAPMLHEGISRNYVEKLAQTLGSKGVYLAGQSDVGAPSAAVAWVSGDDFLQNPHLHEEVFGPFSLMVICKDAAQLAQALDALGGQLTCSLWAEPEDLQAMPELMSIARRKAGRIVLNGVPTGVAVAPAMTHGGPFPASTDSRFTAVGIHAVRRWVRPVSFQNFSDELLPDELKNKNLRGIWRLVNNSWTRDDI